MRATAIILGIVVAAAGCDKTAPPEDRGPSASTLDLSTKPEIVFQVFGERGDPRLVPIAAVVGNALVPLDLTPADWARFDSLYFSPGTTYPAVRRGRVTGSVTVRQGMFSSGTPLYTLPGCANPLPMAAATLDDPGAGEFTVELFALTRAGERAATPAPVAPESTLAVARRIGAAAGAEVDLDGETLAALDFRSEALFTGASAAPTILAAYLDPLGGDEGSGKGNTANLLVLAELRGDAYTQAYLHALNGEATGVEFRRFVDIVDVNGDGVAEVFLEGWRFAGDAAPIALSWRGEAWVESFRGRGNWCLDAPRR
jgi:hypothetical protein